MKRFFFVSTLFACTALFFDTSFSQDNSAYFTVGGEVLKPLKLSVKELSILKGSEVKGKDRDGKEHTFKGVMLWTILDSAGVTLGKDLRGENLAKYVLVKARDGYEVVFSLPEIDPEFSEKIILLAYAVDGKPLAANEGPFRLVVPQDKKHARWVRQLNSIQILFSKN
jgi:DMSO/TMAO reductase YedYZ molybdopterin-dependent catalytic subunit